MKPKLVIFDFWGTLAYFPMTDLKEFYSSLKDFGIKVKTAKEIKRFSSLFSKSMCFSENWLDFSQQILEGFVEKPRKEKTKVLSNFLKEKLVFELYDDIKEALNLPFKKAILTNSARLLVENSGLQASAKIFTPKETKFLKPDKRAFLAVLRELKAKPEESLMIGDEIERDLIPAQNLGMETILIDRNNSVSEAPMKKIRSLRELRDILDL
ncbi:MAG: HAD family hydrolase [Candidatus Paceibacterales bacterium]